MENPNGEGSGQSEELKPSCPERKEHMDSDDGKMVHESISPFHSDENSDVLVTKSISEGNVIVQPEPKKEEDKDDFQEPEVRHKSRMKTKHSKRHVGERLHEFVCCTACGQQVNHHEDSVYRHPALNVLICKSCYIYTSGDISHGSPGPHKHCRWCAEGRDLIICDFCPNAFCKKCIRRNLGEKEMAKVMDKNTKWSCYICQPEPLLDLVAICDCVFDNLSHLDQQSKKKKLVSEKTDNTCDPSEKLNHGSCAEETHQVYNPSSDAASPSFPILLIPKALVEKTKTLVENLRETNATFLKHLQQTFHCSEVSPSETECQYEIMKYMVMEVCNALEGLEDCLSNEVIKLVREMEENNKERENENV
ncbi:transcriptional regulator ATRX-like isoform X1 [Antechinus flavipes]|uniref:transcriptional regulator ATRX-like isoform X1 n=1 Tax=Antechinus flavipes TaxID=38775 RepID=UPI0022362DE3|nr:transcriptional regulator ATRX-like isoform X1 [Antechinus flavipes]